MEKPICEQVDLLSEEECKVIVTRAIGSSDFRLASYRIENTSGENIGFLGDYFRLTTVIEIGSYTAKQQFFIKSLPVHEEQRTFLRESGIFDKEVTLYETLLANFNAYSKTKWLPKCFYSRPDILVLEDLLVQGYYHIPNSNEFTKENVQTALSSLAALHASSIAYELKTNINIGVKYKELLFETSIDSSIGWFITGIKALRDAAALHPKFQSESHQEFLANDFLRKIEPIYDTINPSSQFRNVLCHRDCWGRNIMFTKDRGSVRSILVDFQICRYCPPAIDVLFCIYMNTTRKVRHAILEECIECYYESLRRELKALEINVDDHITWSELVRSCDALKLMPLVYYGLINTIVYLPNDILARIKNEDPEKFRYYAYVNRSAIVLDQIEKHPHYRDTIFEAVEELVEYLLQN